MIIPTYNRLGFLKEALDSVAAQTFTDYEVIVVDDGSQDGTCEWLVCERPDVQLLTQSNSGPGAARNLGAKHARGQYFAFLDSDDLWFPWTLGNYWKAINIYCRQPSFVAGTSFDSCVGNELQAEWSGEPTCEEYCDYLRAADSQLWIGTCGVAIERSAFLNCGGFASGLINAEDSDLWLRLGTSKGFIRISSPPAFVYRRHDDSAVAMFQRTINGLEQLVLKEKSSIYPGGSVRSRERRHIITRHVRPAVIECLRKGNHREAWRLYRLTLAWHILLGRFKFVIGFWLIALRSWWLSRGD